MTGYGQKYARRFRGYLRLELKSNTLNGQFLLYVLMLTRELVYELNAKL